MSLMAALVWTGCVVASMCLLLLFARWLDRRDARKRREGGE